MLRLQTVLVYADVPGQLSNSIHLLKALLLSCVALQGCAVEIAPLNDSTFGGLQSSLSTERSVSASELMPNKIIRHRGLAVSALDAERSKYSNKAAESLSSEADQMLALHGYAATSAQNNSDTTDIWPGKHATSLNRATAFPGVTDSTYSIDAVTTPIEPVLFSLAADAGLQYRSHDQLNALVTVSIVDKPLKQILSVLAEQAGFFWQVKDNTLTVRGGGAYGHTYSVNYLNMHRRTQSSVGLATQVGTINVSDGSGNSVANSSQTRIENVSEHHFWQSLENDANSIISQSHDSQERSDADLSVNRDAGLLSLFATPDVHLDIQRYLSVLHANTQRQVLIEATVVEVALSRHFEAGVDWQVIASGISGVNAAQILLGAPAVVADTVDRITAPAGLVSVVQSASQGDVKATLSLLEQFGDVRILSRPRIIAMNNQSSVLKVVDNRVYFTVHVQRKQTEDKDEVTTETQIHTVPVGLVMNVTPQISQNGNVMLNIRPTLSRILGFVNDPNPELALANVRNGVPEIQVREMESMLQVQSGDVAIIGGLMQETQTDNDAQLPGLGRIPVIGKMFSKQSRERRQTELLIVLRPTVLESAQSVAQ